MQERPRNQEHEGAEPSRLAELLACERGLADLMKAAREDASLRVEAARAAASTSEAEVEAALEQEAQRVLSEVRSESQARVHQILSGAGASVARFERVSDDEVERLADAAFRRLLGPGDAP
jgi:vacuolar-type H+-ATPase subunit H